MVTSNKAWVGSLPSLSPSAFPSFPHPDLADLVACACCRELCRMCFPRSTPISSLGIVTQPSCWELAVAAQVCRSEGCGTWSRCCRGSSGWLTPGHSEARRSAHRSLRFGYWCICPGGGDHLCKLMNDRDVGFPVQNGSTFCLVHTGSRKQGSGETLECQLGCPHWL